MNAKLSTCLPERGVVLNGWKEIARYLGRGVRTVQRWEVQFDLPIRRPALRLHSAVLAITQELDAWLRTRDAGLVSLSGTERDGFPSDLESLERKRLELIAQLAVVERRLQRMRAQSPAVFGLAEAASAAEAGAMALPLRRLEEGEKSA